MFRQQSYQAGEIARSPVKGTIPKNYTVWKMTTEEAEASLKNPVPYTNDSVQRGKRIFQANCRTCHGLSGVGDGPVGAAMGVPNIMTDFYKQKSDGRTYGVLMNGGSNMPRYGYKFSETERWDVINYVRFLQGNPIK